MEGVVDFTGSCGEGRVGSLFLASRISVRTGLRLEPAVSSNSSRFFSPSNVSTLSSRPSSPGRSSRSLVFKFTTHVPEIYLFFSHSCVYLFRRGLLPGPRGSRHPPPKRSAPPRNPSRRDICSTSPFRSVSRRFRPKALEVYKPAPKVPRPASSPVPQPSLIRDLVPLLRSPITMSVL